MMHVPVGAQKPGFGALPQAVPMDDQFTELLRRIEALGDRDLTHLLAIVAAAVADRLITTEQEGLAAEREEAENLEGAPWRLAKGRAKGIGKGKGNAKGRDRRGKGGPYGK